MNQKSIRSAVVVSPPEKFWPQIQDIRRNHDKAYVRWLPHINLLYPFVPESAGGFSSEVADIQTGLRNGKIESFPVIFSKESFGYFKHGRSCTIWLKPLQLKRVGAQNSVPNPDRKSPQESPKPQPVQMVDFHKKATSETRKKPVAKTAQQSELSRPARNPAAGLDQLQHAIWDDSDLQNIRKPPTEVSIGLDSLRYAVWLPGDTSENEKVKFVATEGKSEKPKDRTRPPDLTRSERHASPKFEPVQPPRSHSPTVEELDADLNDFQIQPPKQTKKKKHPDEQTNEYECLNTSAHPEMIHLQKCLVDLFPHCNDLSTRSPEGFQPHLTLAQCDHKNVDSFMESLKRGWKDICFIVDSVHLISRRDNDPFVIRETVQLN